MNVIDAALRDTLIYKIVEDYGDGVFRLAAYVFEQITRLRPRTIANRVMACEFVSKLQEDEIVVILDSHPNNRQFAQQVAEHCGNRSALAFSVSKRDVAEIVRFADCDMYLLTRDGNLLAVGTHEDTDAAGERLIWVPTPVTA